MGSPRLQIRFQMTDSGLELYRPDGQRFLTHTELGQQLEQERQRAERESERAEQERQRAEQERQRADRLAAQLRAAGLDSDD